MPIGGIAALNYRNRGHLDGYVGMKGGFPGWLKPGYDALGGDQLSCRYTHAPTVGGWRGLPGLVWDTAFRPILRLW